MSVKPIKLAGKTNEVISHVGMPETKLPVMRKKITPLMFKMWWNISNLDVNEIILSYTDILNYVSHNSDEDSIRYVNEYIDGIINYEKTWNDTGKEW